MSAAAEQERASIVWFLRELEVAESGCQET